MTTNSTAYPGAARHPSLSKEGKNRYLTLLVQAGKRGLNGYNGQTSPGTGLEQAWNTLQARRSEIDKAVLGQPAVIDFIFHIH